MALIALAFHSEGGTGMPIMGAGIGTGEGEGELGLYGGEHMPRACKRRSYSWESGRGAGLKTWSQRSRACKYKRGISPLLWSFSSVIMSKGVFGRER